MDAVRADDHNETKQSQCRVSTRPQQCVCIVGCTIEKMGSDLKIVVGKFLKMDPMDVFRLKFSNGGCALFF